MLKPNSTQHQKYSFFNIQRLIYNINMGINGEIAKIFLELAFLYEMKNDRFRARAYERGGMELENLAEDAEDIYKRSGLEGLEDLPGIGRGMAEKIEEYANTGHIKEYDDMKKDMPVDIEGLSAVQGLGAKSIATLYSLLGIKTVEDLEKAARSGKILELKGFGEKTERNILEGIEFVKKNTGRMILGYALPRAKKFIDEFREMSEVTNISEAGSLRRRAETVGDIDILISSKDPEKVMDRFLAMNDTVKVWGKGDTKASIRIKGNFDMDLRVVLDESWGAALQYFTGSKAHNIKLRQIAIDKGFKLNEYGLFIIKAGSAVSSEENIGSETEEDVYRGLGLSYIEPELREDTGEIEAALENRLPEIIPYGSLKGDLQVQTDWTDGENSIEDMAIEAKRQGLKYIAITDHTKSLAMTGGCDERKLFRQMAEIDKLNLKSEFRNSAFRILKGAEVNILKDGSLDISDEVLAKLDVVGVSVHSLFKMSKDDMTDRIVRAIQNPNVDILFHPTGRLIQKREAYEADMERIIKEAVKTGTLLEINAFPTRLDLKDHHIRLAVEAGARFSIDSDAHSKAHFKYLEFGIAQARRGWATAKDVSNTLEVEAFLKELKGKKV